MKNETTAPRIHPARLGGIEFAWIGGDAVLDFHNTIAWPPRGKSNERLPRPVELVRWAAEGEIITIHEAAKLRGYCIRNGSRSRRELAVAIQLRDLLHAVLSDLAAGRAPGEGLIGALNHRLRKVREAQTIEWQVGALRWSPPSGNGTTTILARLVLKAADLVTSARLQRLRTCANPKCGWLFLDTTRNRLRKWCSMAECGGRAKSKRYYESQKKLMD